LQRLNQALIAAHYLLGSGIDDFVPKMAYCENSVCQLLQAIANRGGPEVPVFIQTVGGDLNAINNVHAFSTLFATLLVLSKGNAPTNLTKQLKYVFCTRFWRRQAKNEIFQQLSKV
jgi:hypothetical protein